MDSYEAWKADQIKKLRIILQAATLNSIGSRDVEITTCGLDPHARFRIRADLLEMHLKD